jgi:hypothetical protein
MPYVYITSFSGPPATITVCDTSTGTICYNHPTQLTDLGPFPFIILCSILPTPSPTSGPVPCFEVVINGDFDTDLSGWTTSNPSNFDWSSFNGGSAEYVGEDSYAFITQTGYTFLTGFNYTISYDVYNTDPTAGFIWPGFGDNPSVDITQTLPYSPLSAWTHYNTVLECYNINQLSFSGFNNSSLTPVYLDNVSACFTYGPCYYMQFATNDNFGILGTGEIQYVDCDGILQTYSASSPGSFYLCAVQSPGSIDIDLVGQDYLCDDIGGTWVGPTIPSPTPTPSNPPTPTPTSPAVIVLGSMYFSANVPSNSTARISLQTNTAAYSFINWGDGTVDTLVGGVSGTKIHTYSSPYNGNIVVSAETTVAGKVTSILDVKLFSTANAVVPKLSGFTSQFGKCPNLQNISQAAGTFARLIGTTSDLSGCTNMTELSSYLTNITGDISHLPDSITRIILSADAPQSEPNFVNTLSGNISGLPNSVNYVDIRGNNTITGDIAGITSLPGWQSDSTLTIRGNNTISGNMSNLPNIQSITIWNNGDADEQGAFYSYTGTTISGPLSLKSNHKDILIAGANTISGPLTATTVPTTLDRLRIMGLNTISGNLNELRVPRLKLALMGNNTISGSLQDMTFSNAATLQMFQIKQLGQGGGTRVNTGNTISGNINVFTNTLSLNFLYLGGLNSVSGDLSAFNNYPNDAFIKFGIVSAFNTITASSLYTNERFVQYYLYLNTNAAGFTSNQTNKVLQMMNAEPVNGTMNIVIGGNHDGPTGAGLTAKTSLVNQGASVMTNP